MTRGEVADWDNQGTCVLLASNSLGTDLFASLQRADTSSVTVVLHMRDSGQEKQEKSVPCVSYRGSLQTDPEQPHSVG